MKLIPGDCLEKLKELEENSVDSIVTDPPYELGFMGKKWDNTGIAYSIDLWRECLRVLKPGGHLLAFSGTRTYHRMACAIEDAGFEIRDQIQWVYGSGFPKSSNISKAIDKKLGAKREVIGKRKHPTLKDTSKLEEQANASHGDNLWSREWDITAPATSEAQQYDGWGTALKPAHEPICMARKPLSEKTVAENCLKWGTGGINIDQSRVGAEQTTTRRNGNSGGEKLGRDERKGEWLNPPGRFPANLIHDNSEEVRECFPETKSGAKKANQENYNHEGKEFVATLGASVNEYQASSGNASRFFKSIIYTAKASKSDRGNGNNHPTVKPVALMEYLITMITPKGGVVLDPFMGSGTTGVACKLTGKDFIGIEREESYFEIAKARIEEAQGELFNAV